MQVLPSALNNSFGIMYTFLCFITDKLIDAKEITRLMTGSSEPVILIFEVKRLELSFVLPFCKTFPRQILCWHNHAHLIQFGFYV